MKAFTALALCACLSAGPAFATEAKNGFRFLERPAGARQAAMGDTAVSLPDDANAVLWNPAGLADARQRELSFGYAKLLDGVNAGAFSYVHPFPAGGLGVAVFSEDAGETEGYAPGDVKSASFDTKSSYFSAGWGRSVGRHLRLGANVKQASQDIAGYSGSAMAFDAGTLLQVPAPEGWKATVAAALRNQGGNATFISEETGLPASIGLGASLTGFSDALTLALENHRPSSGQARWRIGGELWLQNVLALRTGFKTGQGSGSGFSLGLGFRTTNMLQIDYAYAPNQDFGASHQAGITLRFGGPADRDYQEGVRLAQKGEYAEAILKFEAALDADPRHAGAVRGLRDATRRLELLMGRELNNSKGAQ